MESIHLRFFDVKVMGLQLISVFKHVLHFDDKTHHISAEMRLSDTIC